MATALPEFGIGLENQLYPTACPVVPLAAPAHDDQARKTMRAMEERHKSDSAQWAQRNAALEGEVVQLRLKLQAALHEIARLEDAARVQQAEMEEERAAASLATHSMCPPFPSGPVLLDPSILFARGLMFGAEPSCRFQEIIETDGEDGGNASGEPEPPVQLHRASTPDCEASFYDDVVQTTVADAELPAAATAFVLPAPADDGGTPASSAHVPVVRSVNMSDLLPAAKAVKAPTGASAKDVARIVTSLSEKDLQKLPVETITEYLVAFGKTYIKPKKNAVTLMTQTAVSILQGAS